MIGDTMNDPTNLQPPHSIEAERALIGCALFDPEGVLDISLGRQDFYNAKLGAVWGAMKALHKEGHGVDLITLPEVLKARGVDVGIIELLDLQNEVPTAINAPDYAKIVRAHSKRRRLINLSGTIASEAYSGKPADPLTLETIKRVYEGDEEQAGPKWKIQTVADAYKDRRPTRYLIDGILPTPSVNVWYGAPGSRKSLLLADMAVTVVAGARWLPGGNEEYVTIASRVLWIDTDNGNDVSQERFAAFAKAKGLTAESPLFYISMPDPWLFAADINSQMDLRATIARLNVNLIIIDNLGNITGDIDENSAQMVRVMSPFRQIADDLNVAFILVHHQRKGGANGGRSGDALRGHSVIEASLDFAVLVTTEDGSDITSIKCTKARRFRFDDIRCQFNYDHQPGTKDLDLAWWTVPVPKRGDNPVRDAILDTLRANGEMTQTRLIDSVYDFLSHKYSKPKIRSWLDEMTELTKEVEVEKGPNNARVLSLKHG
jgi:hypothetical protein